MENNITKVEKVLYTGKTNTKGGREGASKSSDGKLNILLSSPGTSGQGTNPEQLFAAGWSACFIGAMRIAAGKLKIKLPEETTVDAEVDLCLNGDQYFLRTRLNINLPGIEKEVAKIIVDSAHQTCPYSKMSRGNIDVVITVL